METGEFPVWSINHQSSFWNGYARSLQRGPMRDALFPFPVCTQQIKWRINNVDAGFGLESKSMGELKVL
jgi:hypothetical protein